jgi:Zn-dependent protease
MFGTLWFMRFLDVPNGHVILAAWVLWVIASITLHELAHGWAAIAKGDRTPIDSGHMTFNPIVHMGIPSLLMFALTGIAWGQMPVDATRLRGRHAEAIVAFAGPAMNLALTVLCIVLGGVAAGLGSSGRTLGLSAEVLENLWRFFLVGAGLNIGLALFNLIPIYPLDGGRIVASYSRGYRDFVMTQAGSFVTAALFIVAFLFAGSLIGGVGFGTARAAIDVIDGLIARVFGGGVPLILPL